MDVYLPIAEISVNAPLLVAAGALVGFISGMFGIGGGFLMTPILVFLGVPAPVAVASMAGHVAASSTSSVLAYSAGRGVDFRMGGVLAAGGSIGALAGVEVFRWLRLAGQADLAVALAYLVFLGVIGTLMLRESIGALIRRRRGEADPAPTQRRPALLYGLPFRLRFPRSRLYISVLPPLALGALAGILSAVMGVGGGFILVPAMIYLLRMPAGVVVGTSLFQIILTTSLTTLLQAGRNQTVDIVLTGLLVLGGVFGAQLGARASSRFRAEELRILLALIILAIGLSMGLRLILTPGDPFVLLPAGA
ncbi:MAG: sulfite exporter TauE/SafE family protein [Phenylobacterium sp.]|nr:sulfite exporter TauE/SafE family protein [Phenylobacterium sp.]MCA3710724.1 sulfite exporter TauE/SafE family protein [Phenylobacterium sp.]MCA3711107.1 sulfite exporter TauE/SafE family protein [Phenylobacterium sp.]MCA3713856.1 sulfite exporter TauE/SafE family protein [Phenylobacterium sp.]MCA3723390.1 sulfite exporter TauE/SafE family protein [Phenylobacterium sp.]MCA3726088.1 sulfite exporter TauE/SafE family protein [Phenylobacterium sp.]